MDAAIQENSISASCPQSETLVIVVMLPMSKSSFIEKEDMYINSVATTAGVTRENVKILSIDEVSVRSARIVTGRLLLEVSVHVQTSVIIAVGQQTYIKDQTVLNSNLNKNGLPSGTLVVQNPTVVNVTAPVSGPGDSSSNVPVGAIVGGVVGISVLLAALLVPRLRKTSLACPLPPLFDCKIIHLQNLAELSFMIDFCAHLTSIFFDMEFSCKKSFRDLQEFFDSLI
jgi:hypothetical protein